MSDHFQRVAHRGGSHLAPENTLAAFRNALTLQVDAIELDVHMSRDGHAIVFHDYTVEGRTDGQGNILDLDFAYLRSLNAAAHFPGGWPQPEQIPTLSEVLNLAKGRVQIYIEIKPSKRNGAYGRYPNIAQTVVNEVNAAGMLNQVLVISFDWTVLPEIKALEPKIQTGALVSEDVWAVHAENSLDTLMQQTKSLGVNWINLDKDLFRTDILHVAHGQGFKLGLWTVNTINELSTFADAGVDSLTTDRPDFFAVF
jgi:glycerophosphoryl diester phosphodiesterase